MGILKAGGAYVPIDPSYPTNRIHYLLENSAAPVLLTQSRLTINLPLETLGHTCDVICLDKEDFGKYPIETPRVKPMANDLAYVIYTSGSTGKPKGVMIEHGGLVNLALAQIDFFCLFPESRVLQFASFSFDASVSEITTTLLAGACLYLVPNDKLMDPAYLTPFMVEQQISHVTLPPSFLSTLSVTALPCLKTLVVAGEPCPIELVNQWADNLRFINGYGPTEATVGASMAVCSPGMVAPPIGRPIANTRIYILDKHHHPLPPGIPGELCIAGMGLARGYLNRPGLTAEKFITVDLFGKTERIYKTGDLARWLPNGNLDYLGRMDHQVKLRGFRIELGEIEALLRRHPGVNDVLATLYQDVDNKQLTVYLTTEQTSDGSTESLPRLKDSLKELISANLPNYMMPSHFIVLDHLPLTPNGKIDRKALPAPKLDLANTHEPPRNAVEHQLIQIWSSFLHQETIGIHDNFFSLGGDSILSIQIVARAREVGLNLTPKDLFEHQTIALLAARVDSVDKKNETPSCPEQGLVKGDLLLTPIQQWFFDQDLSEYRYFNQSILLDVPTDLTLDVLQSALAALLFHHDALRLRYTLVNHNWRQSFSPPEETIPCFVEDLCLCDHPLKELKKRAQGYQTGLNITSGPTTSLVLFKLTDSARLFWTIHHLMVDGVSWRILLEDLETACRQLAAGRPMKFPPKTSSFKAWSNRLHAHGASGVLSSQVRYWQALAAPSLPIDVINKEEACPKTNGSTRKDRHVHTRNYTLSLTPEETQALLYEVPTAYNTRINDVLLAALALALYEWTKESHCLIDLEGHGRTTLFESIDLSRTVGWFTTVHPVALVLPPDPLNDLGAALKAIKEQLRTIPQDGIGYGLLVQQGETMLPRAEILFNYLGQFDQTNTSELFTFSDDAFDSNIGMGGKRDHLIDINGVVRLGILQLNWSYAGDCFLEKTIETLASDYKRFLQSIIDHCSRGNKGVTPSDFPLATITPSALDRLYDRYPGLQDLYPLSPMQQGMVFHALYEPGTGVYFEQLQLNLRNLDPAAFKAAWQHQLERHPVFRSVFLTDPHPGLQVVHDQVPLVWKEHDWKNLSQTAQQEQLQNLLHRERQHGFDLGQAPLMRFDLIQLDTQVYTFVEHHHHLLMDGWCLPIIFSEIRDSYLAFKQGKVPQLPKLRPYADYIGWLQQQDKADFQHYWQHRLAGFREPTQISIITHKSQAPDFREVSYTLETQTTQQLQHFSQKQHITLNTLIQGAWGLLLCRYGNTEDICFGVTVSGRNAPLPGIEQMVGLFINTIPLRIEPNHRDTVIHYLQQVQSQHQDDNRYAHSPLFDVQNLCEVPNGTALFESLLVFENYPLGDALDTPDDCYQIESIQGIELTNYPLTLSIIPGRTLCFKMSYDSHRVNLTQIEHLWTHLNTLLVAMVHHPDLAIGKLSMLTKEHARQILTWNDTDVNYSDDGPRFDGEEKTIDLLFDQQVKKTPDNIAIYFKKNQLTYRQLNDRANRLAVYLLGLKAKDGRVLLKANPLIAICLERSFEMVIGLLAILKAGGAYVPIDPSYPGNRIQYMLTDSAPPLLITRTHLKTQLPLESLEHECIVVCLDEADCYESDSDNRVTEKPLVQNRKTDRAYVIYTSGSTGNPKGVVISHRAISSHCRSIIEFYGFVPEDCILQSASFGVDTSLEQILPALMTGAALVIRDDTIWGPREFLGKIVEYGITSIDLPPAYFYELLSSWADLEDKSTLGQIRQMIVGGEAMSRDLVRLWQGLGLDSVLINAYGPTEACITAIAFKIFFDGQGVDLSQNIPIGKPIGNTRAYILDKYLNLLPEGVTGELYLGGDRLATAYLNQPALTEQRFVRDMFARGTGSENARLYRTGDLVRYIPGTNGLIEFLGRGDDQVKIRGFRVELGEIASVISEHSKIEQSAVFTSEGSGGELRIIASVVCRDEGIGIGDLKAYLKQRLPDFMQPAAFLFMEKIPLTPGGKVDRDGLRLTYRHQVGKNTASVGPRDHIEEGLVRIWTDILEIPEPGMGDNFFDLGGHSILCVRLITQINKDFNCDLPVSAVMAHPDIEGLATLIRERSSHHDVNPLVLLGRRKSRNPGLAPPVFLVHPIGGNLFSYGRLASTLSENRMVYGLKAQGLDGVQEPLLSIPEMAEKYIEAVQAIQSHGPYYLGGWSMGGLVAYEMAQRLRLAGESVLRLVLVDTYTSVALKKLIPKTVDEIELRQFFEHDLGMSGMDVFADTTMAEKYFKVFKANSLAMDNYYPAPYGGDLILIQADHDQSYGSFNGWKKLIKGELTAMTVPGNHYTILQTPGVKMISKLFSSPIHTV